MSIQALDNVPRNRAQRSSRHDEDRAAHPERSMNEAIIWIGARERHGELLRSAGIRDGNEWPCRARHGKAVQYDSGLKWAFVEIAEKRRDGALLDLDALRRVIKKLERHRRRRFCSQVDGRGDVAFVHVDPAFIPVAHAALAIAIDDARLAIGTIVGTVSAAIDVGLRCIRKAVATSGARHGRGAA